MKRIWANDRMELVVCYHEAAPPEGLCPDCGLTVYSGLPRGGTRLYRPLPVRPASTKRTIR